MRSVESDISKHQILSELTKASKNYWNYPKEWMLLWDEDLTITEDYIKNNKVFHLKTENKLAGYYSYFEFEKGTVQLDYMFVHPYFIGKGFGNFLMNDFFEKIKSKGYEKIIVDADPNAESFYKKFGFKTIEQKITKIENRFLPVMMKTLKSEL